MIKGVDGHGQEDAVGKMFLSNLNIRERRSALALAWGRVACSERDLKVEEFSFEAGLQ